MRLILAVIVMISWPMSAAAQVSTLAPLPPLPPIGLPLPPITSPLTPIGLPLVSTGFPPPAPIAQHRPRPHPRRGLWSPAVVVYVIPTVDWGFAVPARSAMPGAIASPVAPVPEPPPPSEAPSVPVAVAAEPADVQLVEPPAEPSTFYFIPGCYIGNIPPDAVKLPANCDRRRLIIRTP